MSSGSISSSAEKKDESKVIEQTNESLTTAIEPKKNDETKGDERSLSDISTVEIIVKEEQEPKKKSKLFKWCRCCKQRKETIGVESRDSAIDLLKSYNSSFISEVRRQRVPDRLTNQNVSLWTILKDYIGGDMSKISLPVNFSEPISMIQRLTEDFEYSDVLDNASRCASTLDELCYVAAFTVSSYASTSVRTAKPFNPLLGETFEWDRSKDLGWKVINEQVGHHPPMGAQHCEGKQWTCWQTFMMTSHLRMNYLDVIPLGVSHLTFKKTNSHYTWKKVTTIVHNLIIGKLWVEQMGEMEIKNHLNGERCTLKYHSSSSSFFGTSTKQVTGTVYDSTNTPKYTLNGFWDKKMESTQILKDHGNGKYDLGSPKLLWARRFPNPESEHYYNFTVFASQLNEPNEPNAAPTDSRFRPDQRFMEMGLWDQANSEKRRLEEKQRLRKVKREEIATAAIEKVPPGTTPNLPPEAVHIPLWFVGQKDPYSGMMIYVSNNQYWEAKKKQDWSKCLNIFGEDK